MIYIRTKDTILKYEENIPLGITQLYFCCDDKGNIQFDKTKKVYREYKKARTIRELCDTFVCESNEEGNNFTKTNEDFFQMLRDDFYQRFRSHYNFYGAIHVKEKGSIYVAKLNKEGELELI
jgi:hypothetical protein